eukprot:261861-Pelagomonas_calceolata.AAC.1
MDWLGYRLLLALAKPPWGAGAAMTLSSPTLDIMSLNISVGLLRIGSLPVVGEKGREKQSPRKWSSLPACPACHA